MEVIRLKKGDFIVESLETKLRNQPGGVVYGVGALSSASLMLYNLKDKSYCKKKINGPLEVCSFTAIVAKTPDGKIGLHAHIVVSSDDFICFGGHLEEAEVAATFEAVFIKSDQVLERKYSKQIGLNLLKG